MTADKVMPQYLGEYNAKIERLEYHGIVSV